MTDLEFQQQLISDAALIKWHDEVEAPQAKALIREHVAEMGREGEWLRCDSLLEQLRDVDDQLFEEVLDYEKCNDSPFAQAMIVQRIEKLIQVTEKLEREFDYLVYKGQPNWKPNENIITPDMVERAKDYPIENLIDTRRGFALCCFHQDKNPSMYIKNNFAHCFSCGKTADTIDVYRQLYGATFPEAVKALQ